VHQLIQCQEAIHSAAILDILNEAILTSTALYDYTPRTMDSVTAWFATKRAHQFPIIGLTDDTGSLLGFASFGTFRAFPAFKYSVEHSVYVHHEHRGRGLGAVLLRAIIAEAEKSQMHMLVGAIDADNKGSIALHQAFGFTHAGTVQEAGFKFGRWLDLAFYQKKLLTPRAPVDG
jgi:L-amino acid N-acyltransferase